MARKVLVSYIHEIFITIFRFQSKNLGGKKQRYLLAVRPKAEGHTASLSNCR